MKRIKIFDTTLRDGEQSPGCSMNLSEKIEMAKQLEKLGVDIIEAGFAIASPMDHKSVQAIAGAVTNCTVASLARCTKGDIDAAWDAVKEAKHPRIHVFLATSEIHMKYKLQMSPEQVLQRISDMVSYAKSFCDDIEFSAEDASRSDWARSRSSFPRSFRLPGSRASWISSPMRSVSTSCSVRLGAAVHRRLG